MSETTEEGARTAAFEFLQKIGRDGGFDRERVAELLGPALSESNPNVGPIRSFSSPFGTVAVAARTGDVVRYSMGAPSEPAADPIDRDAALEAAMQFARAVYRGFEDRRFELTNESETDADYNFSLRESKKPGEVSIFVNFISLSVRKSDAAVIRYGCSNLDFRRTDVPRVSEDEARRLMRPRLEELEGEIESIRLVEEPVEEASRAVTVWSIGVAWEEHDAPLRERFLIDAETGQFLELDN